MARPKKTDAPDLSEAQELTAGLIERLTCRTDIKAQAFLRDSKAPGLRVRVTNTGTKSFVFEAKLNRQTIRRTIGDVRAWSIEQARQEARRLAVVLDGGQRPTGDRASATGGQSRHQGRRRRPGADRGRCVAAVSGAGQAQAERRMEAALSGRPESDGRGRRQKKKRGRATPDRGRCTRCWRCRWPA